MGVSININLSEIEKLQKRLNSFCLSDSQKRSLLNDVGVEVKEQILDRFDLDEDPEGNPWKKLVDATIKYKNKICDGGILERSGMLKTTLTSQVIDENTVIIGSPMEYAEYHQIGTKILPFRPFLGLSTDNIDDLDSLIYRWVNNHVK